VLYFSEWDKKKETLAFAEEQFPAGVIQLVLFDRQMNPLSERLVFSKNFDETTIDFQTNKTVYEKREGVVATLSLTDSAGNLLDGHLSVAITDDKDISIDESTTIRSSLLLSSELKGYIENPAYYLQNNNESAIALDYLMMTHGWRRYDIPEVVKGNPSYPQIPYQTSQEISGLIKSLILSRPVANSEISVMTKDRFLGSTTTDKNGRFLLQGFEYPDSTQFFVQALSSKGSDRIELVVDEEQFPQPIQALKSPIINIAKNTSIVETNNYLSSNTNAFIAKAEQRARYDETMWVIHLSDVEVTAPKIDRKEELRLRFPLNESSDIKLRRDVFEQVTRSSVSDYLAAAVPGLRVILEGMGYSSIYFTSAGAFNPAATSPLFIIDGITWTGGDNPLDQFSVSDIESIDVFNGPSAAMFGVRGNFGVISVTTRRGLNSTVSNRNEFNYTVHTPSGYQKPVEFYSPRYETLEAKHLTIPDYRTTIFWKPDILISDTGEASFDFYTSDFPTTYSVVIEGITTDGRFVRQVEKIQVE
jgi:hypothetical protein